MPTFLQQIKSAINVDAPWTTDQPLYKYVDYEDRKYLLNGSVKIGALRGYAKIEGPRRDTHENTSSAKIAHMTGDTPEERDFLRATGALVEGGGRNHWFDYGSSSMGPNLYCLCTSYRGDLPDGGKHQAVFRIDDPSAWMRRILELNPGPAPASMRPVEYGSRQIFQPNAMLYAPNPFLKPRRFEKEHEVRLISERPISDEAEPIYGANDRRLAALMKWIR